MKEKEEEKPRKKEKQRKKRGKEKVLMIFFGGLCAICFTLFLFLYFFVPTIELTGPREIKMNVFSSYKEQGATALLHGQKIKDGVIIEGSVDTSKVGDYELIYKTAKGLLESKTKRVVHIVDEEAPVITLNEMKKKLLCPKEVYQEDGFTAVDNYDGDITSKVVSMVTEEKTKVIYTVTDSSGNQGKATRDLTYGDKEAPTITIKGGNEVYIEVGNSYQELGATATDTCDGDLTSKIERKGSVDTNTPGTYQITYSVSDSNGNKKTAVKTVYVAQKIAVKDPMKGTIYLTFDDGPSATVTAKILDILKKKGVTATFFVINHSDSLNYLIEREHNEGHTVAIHSYTHNYSQVYSSVDNFFADITKMQAKIEKITGEKVMILRFPGGSSNTISRNYQKGIMSTLTKQVKQKGFHYFDWNVDSNDAGGAKTEKDVYNNVVKNLYKTRSNVVLMHDFENNYKTLNALEDIIDYGIKNGYEFRSIDMTTAMVTHNVYN